MVRVGLRAPYCPSLVRIGCGCRSAPKPVTSRAEAAALNAPFTDDDKRAFWLHVGGTDPNSSTMATVLTAVIIASATIMYLTVSV